MSFIYQEPLGPNQIRLLTIHPGSPDQQLRCDLTVHTYEKTLSYDALSYVWGDPAQTREIMIGSQSFSATLSLHTALTTLRDRKDPGHPGSARPLWVDAVCINQGDELEKGEQIQNMSNVYSRATNVLIFLGKTGDAFTGSLLSLAATVRTHRAGSPDFRTEWLTFAQNTKEVFSAPWFVRVWVIQEAALGRNPVIICGEVSVPFDDIVGASDVVLRHAGQFASIAGARFDNTWLTSSNMFVNTRTGLNDLQLRPAQAFMNNVQMARNSKCRDPKDHVFGLFGLATSVGLNMAALGLSYTQEPDVIFTKVTQSYMNQFEAPLQALIAMNHEGDIGTSDAGSLNGQVRLTGLPSWVPDYSLPATTRFRETLYESGGPAVLHSTIGSFQVYNTTLVSHGVLVGRLDLAFHIGSGTVNQWSLSERLFIGLDPEVEHRGGTRLYGEQAQRLNVYRRAVMADSAVKQSTYKRVHQRYGDNPTGFLNFTYTTFPNDDEYLAEKAKYSWEACGILDMWFFLLSSGHVGIGSPRLRHEDVVVVFPGVSMPLALRPIPCSSRYQMLGPIYVQGIMDGETMVNVESNSNLLQEFRID